MGTTLTLPEWGIAVPNRESISHKIKDECEFLERQRDGRLSAGDQVKVCIDDAEGHRLYVFEGLLRGNSAQAILDHTAESRGLSYFPHYVGFLEQIHGTANIMAWRSDSFYLQFDDGGVRFNHLHRDHKFLQKLY